MLSAVASGGAETHAALAQLHPVRLEDVNDTEAVASARRTLQSHLDRLARTFNVSFDDVLRLAFVVRCNALRAAYIFTRVYSITRAIRIA